MTLASQRSPSPQAAPAAELGHVRGSFTGFAAAIAHDLNNQLTAVLGNLTMMLQREDLEGEVREMAEDSRQSAERIRQMVRMLQTMTGQRPAKVERLNLADHLSRFSNAQLTIEGAPIPGFCQADAGLLDELLSVLHERATLRGRRAGSITVRMDGADAILECVDEMAPRGSSPDLSRWFDLDGRGNERGSAGLGLPALACTASTLGGRAEAFRNGESRICLRVVLPTTTTVRNSISMPRVEDPGNSLRVLVMDDDPSVRGFVQRVFEDLGHSVQTVEDGGMVVDAWAHAIADGAPFDLLLSDLVVPGGVGGHEALERLQARFGAVAAIAMSGHLGHPVLELPRAFGFDAALPKPFTPSDVDEVLRRALLLH